MAEFLARLKQRKLVQWALAYVAFAFALIQVLDVVAGSYDWPHSAMHIVFGVLALGFVVVLVLAWYHGEQGRQRVSGPELLLIALVLAIGGGLLWRFARAPSSTTNSAVASARSPDAAQRNPGMGVPDSAAGATSSGLRPSSFNPPANSIVVLPFTNLSGDPKQRYFSDGITEELTNALGENTGLRVIAWDTASTFRDPKQTATQVGKALDVANLLHGAIEREGDEVRVTVELVNTATGYQVWSTHYDDSFKNIFAVKDKITAAIADALKVRFAGMQAVPTLNPRAHDLYLKGLAALDLFTAVDTQAAQDDFQQAVKLDPNYADAWVGLANSYLQLSEVSTLPLQDALPKVHAAAEKALALDPRNVEALLQLGNVDDNEGRIAQARAEFEQAVALDPSDAGAHLSYGTVLPLDQSLAQFHEAARLRPGYAVAQYNLAYEYLASGDWTKAMAAARAMIKLSPHGIGGAFLLAFAYTQLQRGEDAVRAFDLVHPATALDEQLVDAGRLTYQTLRQSSLRPKALAALNKLRKARISPDSQQDLIPLYVVLGEKDAALQMLPIFCAAEPVACDDLAIDPVWTPLRGDPRFEKLARRYTTITKSQ